VRRTGFFRFAILPDSLGVGLLQSIQIIRIHGTLQVTTCLNRSGILHASGANPVFNRICQRIFWTLWAHGVHVFRQIPVAHGVQAIGQDGLFVHFPAKRQETMEVRKTRAFSS